MLMEISFPGGMAVDAAYKGFTIYTDQPTAKGGAGSGPSPFDLFLSSIGTCAGFFALRFCQERQIDTRGLRLTLDPEMDPDTHRVARLTIDVHLPAGFPEKYRAAILRTIDQCSVKRHILEPPEFHVRTI